MACFVETMMVETRIPILFYGHQGEYLKSVQTNNSPVQRAKLHGENVAIYLICWKIQAFEGKLSMVQVSQRCAIEKCLDKN